jgi:hypothetical protein
MRLLIGLIDGWIDRNVDAMQCNLNPKPQNLSTNFAWYFAGTETLEGGGGKDARLRYHR